MKLKRSIFFVAAALMLCFFGCQKTTVLPNINNAGFENGTSGWQVNMYNELPGASGGVIEEEGESIARLTSEEDNDVRLIQELAVSPNTAYRISCRVKTEGVAGGAGANIGIYGLAVTSEPVFGDSDWREIELKGKTAPGQRTLPVSVCLGGHGALSSGTALFDDVKIELLKDAPEALPLFGEGEAPASASANKTDSAVPTKFPTEQIMLYSCLATAFMLALWLIHVFLARKPFKAVKEKDGSWVWIVLILLTALAVRVALSFIFYGHKTDINCFTAWGRRVVEAGPAHFYESWCDYPPGYMLVLGFMSWIHQLTGGGAQINALLVKVPCIIADLAAAYLIYRYAAKTMRRSAAIALMALAAFTPVIAFVSSGWGQIDMALTLALIIPILLLYKRKPIWAGIVYGVGIIMKPQALMCGPVCGGIRFVHHIRLPLRYGKSAPGHCKALRYPQGVR